MRLEPPCSDLSWLPRLLQTTDSTFPTGGYAHSFGLEGLVQLGVVTDSQTLAQTVSEQIIPALAHFELPFLRLSYEAGVAKDIPRLVSLDERYGAMKGSREFRAASKRIGSQRLLLSQKLFPSRLLKQLEPLFQAHATIVLGVIGAVEAVPLKALLAGCFYQTLAGVISSAVKLLRMGQEGAQKLLTEWLGQTEETVAASLKVEESDIGWFQPVLDIASSRHEIAYTRLFIS